MSETPQELIKDLAALEVDAHRLGLKIVSLLSETNDGLTKVLALSMVLGGQISDAPDEVRGLVKVAALRRIDQTMEVASEMGVTGKGTLTP